MKAQIFAASQVVIRQFNAQEWDAVLHGLLQIVDVAVDEDVEAQYILKQRIIRYLQEVSPAPKQHLNDAVYREKPCIVDGFAHLSFSALLGWLNLYGAMCRPRELQACLRKSGCESGIAMHYTSGDKRHTRRYWRVPHAIYAPPRDVHEAEAKEVDEDDA